MAEQGVVGGELTDTAQQVAAEADRRADEALDQLAGAAVAEPPAQVRDAQGRFVARGQADDDGAQTVTPTPSEPPAATDLSKSDDYKRALRALQYDKVPSSVIEKMSPQDVVAWGTERADNHADVDRLKNEKAELTRQLEEAKALKAQPADAEPKRTSDDLLDKWAEWYGDESRDLARQMMDQAATEAVDRMKGSSERVEALESEVRSLRQSAARSDLEKRFPHLRLDEDDRWAKVMDQRNEDTRAHEDEAEALTYAAYQAFSDEAHAALREQRMGDETARDNGQPYHGTARDTPPAPTQAEQEDDLLNAIQDDDLETRDRISGQMGRRANNSVSELARLSDRRVN
jgi:hypothetical protein